MELVNQFLLLKFIEDWNWLPRTERHIHRDAYGSPHRAQCHSTMRARPSS